MTDAMPVVGHCLCGGVRFEISGKLSNIELCHCAKCQRAYGGPCATTLYARADGFQWTAGEGLLACFDAPLESDPPAYRHVFCERCGTPLPIRWDGAPLVEIPASSLVLGAAPDRTRPAYRMFTCQRSAWFEADAALPSFERAAPIEKKVLMTLFAKPRAGQG